MAAQGITLNGYDLQTSNVITSKIDHESIGIDAAQMKIPHRDGEKLISYTYGVRKIRIEGHITDTTAALLDTRVDGFKQNLIGAQAIPLAIDYNGTTRQYTVNVKNLMVSRDFYNITLVPFSIECEAINPPFGQDAAAIVGYSNATVSGTFSNTISGILTSINVAISGTANPQPTLTFTVNVAGSMTGFQIYNQTTATSIFTTVTPSNNDIYAIDTTNYLVQKNGATITTYSGIFPTFVPGTNVLALTVYGTKPNFT